MKINKMLYGFVMKRGINKVILIGNIGTNPEVSYTQNGTAITQFSVATTDTWKDKQTREQREQTEWHRCVAYRRLAEIAGEYLRKGSKVYIEGRLQTRKWQGQDGKDRCTTEIVVNDLQIIHGPNTESHVKEPQVLMTNFHPTNNYDEDLPF